MAPTYAQLQAERWWGREVVTPEFGWLHAELARALGVPQANVGSKGDNRHLSGAHRSQEWILNSAYCTNRTYTVQQGLSAEQARHLAGCDITPATREQMLQISRNIDRATRSGALEEIREWYGNTDNDSRVDGWNNIANRVATSDSSHLWHLHLTFDRRALRDASVMQRVLAALLGTTTPEGDDMSWNDVTAILHGSTADGWVDATAPTWVRDKAKYNLAALHAKVDALLGRPALVVTPELVDDLADRLAVVLAARPDNPLGEADKPAIKEAVAELLREGIAPPA